MKWRKKPKKQKKRTFGVKAPSFKLQAAYGKEGRGNTIPTKETRAQQCEKNKGSIARITTSWWVSMYVNYKNNKVAMQEK